MGEGEGCTVASVGASLRAVATPFSVPLSVSFFPSFPSSVAAPATSFPSLPCAASLPIPLLLSLDGSSSAATEACSWAPRFSNAAMLTPSCASHPPSFARSLASLWGSLPSLSLAATPPLAPDTPGAPGATTSGRGPCTDTGSAVTGLAARTVLAFAADSKAGFPRDSGTVPFPFSMLGTDADPVPVVAAGSTGAALFAGPAGVPCGVPAGSAIASLGACCAPKGGREAGCEGLWVLFSFASSGASSAAPDASPDPPPPPSFPLAPPPWPPSDESPSASPATWRADGSAELATSSAAAPLSGAKLTRFSRKLPPVCRWERASAVRDPILRSEPPLAEREPTRSRGSAPGAPRASPVREPMRRREPPLAKGEP